MKIVTWNVWFDHYQQLERWNALLAETLEQEPDVIAFQEVTLPLMALIEAHPQLQYWWRTEPDLRSTRDYDVLLLSKRRPETTERVELPTRMGRALCVAHFPDIAVATCHLESLRQSGPARATQLSLIAYALKDLSDVVFVGDMNFADRAPEASVLSSDWVDLWPALHPGKPGFTVNTELNVMRSSSKDGRFYQARFDRVFLRSDHDAWKATRIDLLGTTALADDPLSFPSDHFGLAAELTPA